MLVANPIARIRLERVRRKKRPVLSPAEEALLLPAASSHLREITIVALDTGMRRGEILHQRWEDIDFDRRLLCVTHSKTPEGEARELPLTERVFGVLSHNRKKSGLIFTFEGKPIASLKTAWKGAIRRAGIRYIRFHYLRHTFNTRLLELEVTREVRMALLGHTFGDTHESYEHVELPLKREAIRKLDAWLQCNPGTTQRRYMDQLQRTQLTEALVQVALIESKALSVSIAEVIAYLQKKEHLAAADTFRELEGRFELIGTVLEAAARKY